MRISVLAAFVALIPSIATADSVAVLGRDTADARELSHSVDVTVEPGVAILRVDRTVEFTGKGRADVVLLASLPRGGVVTGVSVEGGGEVEVQAHGDGLLLLFAEVKTRSKRRVTYRVEVPLVPDHGESVIWMPQATEDEGAKIPVVRLGGEVLVAADNPVADPIRVPTPTPVAGRARWGAAKLPSGWVWRAEADAPHTLSARTDHANVVFLLDVSRSQGRKGIERQLALLHRWAEEMPKARYQVVAYARQAEVVFPTWKGADGVRDLGPGHGKLVAHNGSNLDAALQVAADLLAGQSEPAFVLVGTDGEVAAADEAARMSARVGGLGKSSVVHVLLTSGRHTRGAIETRADDHRLAPIALDHGGVPVHIYLPDTWPEPPAGIALENLLRATRIDRYDVVVDGTSYQGDQAWSRLYESQGAATVGRAKREPSAVHPGGLAWGRAWKLDAVRTAAVDRRAALFAAVELPDITAAERKHLGTTLRFVTRETALKASGGESVVVTPRPVDIAAPVIGRGTGRGSKPADTTPAELSFDQVRTIFGALYRPCLDAYRGPSATLQISLEMSWNEILDVTAVGGDTATNACAQAAIWSADLPDTYSSAHAFGMVEEPLAGTPDDHDDRDDDRGNGPPQTEASRSGGCAVGGAGAPWWCLVWVAGACTRRRRHAAR